MAPARLDPDVAYSLLANYNRRTLLVRLCESGATTIDELVDEIVSRDRDAAETDAGDGRERVRISLVHDHLPRLVDHGVVEWDPRGGRVARAEGFAAIESHLDPLRPSDGRAGTERSRCADATEP